MDRSATQNDGPRQEAIDCANQDPMEDAIEADGEMETNRSNDNQSVQHAGEIQSESIAAMDLSGRGLEILYVNHALERVNLLNLRGNSLERLPLSLTRLTALTHLDLRRNRFRHPPIATGGMPALTHLDVRENPLRSEWLVASQVRRDLQARLRDAFETYRSLTESYHEQSADEISLLAEVWSLSVGSGATYVDACRLGLETVRVPSRITPRDARSSVLSHALARLQSSPSSSRSSLSFMPPARSEVEATTSTQPPLAVMPGGLVALTTLPDSLSMSLQRVQSLYLCDNRLVEFPAGIETLGSLHELLLHGNRITALPSSISRLSALRRLGMNANRLTMLPPSLANMLTLQHLSVERNPLVNPPLEYAVEGLRTLRVFLCEPLEVAFFVYGCRCMAQNRLRKAKAAFVRSLSERRQFVPSHVALRSLYLRAPELIDRPCVEHPYDSHFKEAQRAGPAMRDQGKALLLRLLRDLPEEVQESSENINARSQQVAQAPASTSVGSQRDRTSTASDMRSIFPPHTLEFVDPAPERPEYLFLYANIVDRLESRYHDAARTYIDAARYHHGHAENNAGNCYYNNEGLPRDYPKAIAMYTRAIEHGYINAYHNLGNCYYYGNGTPQDYPMAFRLYTEGALRGDCFSQYRLANMLCFGEAGPADIDTARRYYRLAAEQGHSAAREALRRLMM